MELLRTYRQIKDSCLAVEGPQIISSGMSLVCFTGKFILLESSGLTDGSKEITPGSRESDFINTTYDISLDSRTSRRCSKRILSGSLWRHLLGLPPTGLEVQESSVKTRWWWWGKGQHLLYQPLWKGYVRLVQKRWHPRIQRRSFAFWILEPMLNTHGIQIIPFVYRMPGKEWRGKRYERSVGKTAQTPLTAGSSLN